VRRSPKPYHLVDLVRDAKLHQHSLILWPARWKEYRSASLLKWKTRVFAPKARKGIPDKPGVYAFLIQPRTAGINVSCLMYIGKTDRSLKTRFGEYLSEAESAAGRPALSVVLKLYAGYLRFSYAPVMRTGMAGEVEERLIQAFLPPLNRQYPAKVRRVMAAFR